MTKKEIKSKKTLGHRELSKVVGGAIYESPSFSYDWYNVSTGGTSNSNFRFQKSTDAAGRNQLQVYNIVGSKRVSWNWGDGNAKKAVVENYLGTGNSVLFKEAYVTAFGANSWPGWA